MENKSLHPTTKKILEAITANPKTTMRQLADTVGLKSISAIEHHLLKLKAEGIIEKRIYWHVKKMKNNVN